MENRDPFAYLNSHRQIVVTAGSSVKPPRRMECFSVDIKVFVEQLIREIEAYQLQGGMKVQSSELLGLARIFEYRIKYTADEVRDLFKITSLHHQQKREHKIARRVRKKKEQIQESLSELTHFLTGSGCDMLTMPKNLSEIVNQSGSIYKRSIMISLLGFELLAHPDYGLQETRSIADSKKYRNEEDLNFGEGGNFEQDLNESLLQIKGAKMDLLEGLECSLKFYPKDLQLDFSPLELENTNDPASLTLKDLNFKTTENSIISLKSTEQQRMKQKNFIKNHYFNKTHLTESELESWMSNSNKITHKQIDLSYLKIDKMRKQNIINSGHYFDGLEGVLKLNSNEFLNPFTSFVISKLPLISATPEKEIRRDDNFQESFQAFSSAKKSDLSVESSKKKKKDFAEMINDYDLMNQFPIISEKDTIQEEGSIWRNLSKRFPQANDQFSTPNQNTTTTMSQITKTVYTKIIETTASKRSPIINMSHIRINSMEEKKAYAIAANIFRSMLDLSQAGLVKLKQNKKFGEIKIEVLDFEQ